MAEAILQVRIWTDGGKELPNHADLPEAFVPHLEHIKGMCADGFRAGEVVDERFRGWWTIERKGV